MAEYLLQLNRAEHESNFMTYFAELYLKDSLVDVTLVSSEGTLTGAHRLVLSASSSYFQQLFAQIPNKHPVVVLKDVEHEDIQKLLLFIYKGTTKLESLERVERILSVAKTFKLKGLENLRIENPTNKESNSALDNEPVVLQPSSESGAGSESPLSTSNQMTNKLRSIRQVVTEETLPPSSPARSKSGSLFQPSAPDISNSAVSGMSTHGAIPVSQIPVSNTAVAPDLLSLSDASRMSAVAGSSGFGNSTDVTRSSFIKIENTGIISNQFEDESNGEFENNVYMETSGITESRECHDGNTAATALISGDILVTEFQMPEPDANDDQKKFTCKQCGLKFPDWSILWRHMKTHDSGNLIKCDYCPRTYSRADSLRKHITISHGRLSRPRGGRKMGYGKLS